MGKGDIRDINYIFNRLEKTSGFKMSLEAISGMHKWTQIPEWGLISYPLVWRYRNADLILK